MTANSRKRGVIVSVLLFVLAIAGGDLAMITVTGLVKKFCDFSVLIQWVLSTPIIAVGGYCFFGLPQINVWWKKPNDQKLSTEDVRTKFAVKTLSRGGKLAFTLASIVGGPLAIGFYYGYKNDPRARALTWASAWILAAFWAAIYLRLWACIIR